MKLQAKAYKPCCVYSAGIWRGGLVGMGSKPKARQPAFNAGLALCHGNPGTLLAQSWTWGNAIKAVFLPSDEDL